MSAPNFMTPLPYDFARCMTDGCPLAPRCRRKTPGRPGYQSFVAFKGGACCDGFIDGGEDALIFADDDGKGGE